MKNLKIKHKLLALSGILLFSLIFTNVLSLILMAEVNKGTTIVSSNWLPSVILAEELNTNTSNFRIVEASHVISQDEATMLKHEENLKNIATEISHLFNTYQAQLITNEIDKALIEDAAKLWDDYIQIHIEMIIHSKQNDTESAMHIIENESEYIFDEVSDIFLELVQFNKAGADQASLDGDEIYINTLILLMIFMFVTIIIAFTCSTILITSIVNPVKQMEQVSREILKGNLSTEIEYTSSDELGNLSNSMRGLCTMIQDIIEDLSHVLGGMATGDYTVKSKKEDLYVGDFGHIPNFTSDIAEKLANSILQLQHKDILTGLYNRVGFSDRISEILETQPKMLGLVSVNINGLKNINEHSGIKSGDIHIKSSAQILAEHFDYEFFRMSGDELLGIAIEVEKEPFENSVASLQNSMREKQNYDFSLGHSWSQGNHHNITALMYEAEQIMFINKQEYYRSEKKDFDSINDELLKDLLTFLDNEEFMIYLQPQVHLNDGSLYGAEALIRRFDKTNEKMVFPDQFIPLYEQNSIIRHVDLFVVETVCKLLQLWSKEGKCIPISVNLSRVTLQEYGIVNIITQICDKYKVPHELLVIEVTERVGLIENNVASSLITSFKDNGFNISLDDFGCAYSNIVTLAQIEVDEVKIDKSLVDDLTTNPKNNILVKNVLTMCNELENTSTLAEGIEDETQAKLLHELGCHLGQGYYFSRPIPVNEFSDKYID